MKRQFQIVVSKAPGGESAPPMSRLGGLARVKLVFAGALFAACAVSALLFLLVVGSILAVIVWIVLLLAIVGLILKATLRQVSR